MVVRQTFLKNYGYGSFIGILTSSDDKNFNKCSLHYYQIQYNGTLIELKTIGKETMQLEKMARNFINKQDKFIIWNY